MSRVYPRRLQHCSFGFSVVYVMSLTGYFCHRGCSRAVLVVERKEEDQLDGAGGVSNKSSREIKREGQDKAKVKRKKGKRTETWGERDR